MSCKQEFKSRWLDCVVEDEPIRNWCRCINSEIGHAHCGYCNMILTFRANGLKTFKKHAMTNKHRENTKAAHLDKKHALSHRQNTKTAYVSCNKDTDFSDKHFKSKEVVDALTVLYPGMNFNCSVDLLPLSFLYKASKQVRSSDLVSLLRRLVKSETETGFIDIYICFSCGEEFFSRRILRNHQKECNMKLPELPTFEKSAVRPVTCHPSEVSMSLTNTREHTTTYPYIHSTKDNFMSALDLLPKKKAAQVCNRRRNTECETIDLDEDIPISPTFSRSPKLLISHLSRDGNENYGDSSIWQVRRSLFSCHHSRTEKEVNRIGNDENKEVKSEEKNKISHAKSLYSLDLTSPLGQFVIKHIKGDPYLHILSDVESHCLTSTPKKNTARIQLRERHDTYYPVTFKGLFRKFNNLYEHQYKFTRREKVEFLRRVNTGLNKASRALLRKMKPCAVRLHHITKADLNKWMVSKNAVTVDLKLLTADEITYWTSPKEAVEVSVAVFPRGITFSSPNLNKILGLKTCHDTAINKKYNLSVANYVSEEAFAEVTANRRTVYKSLLSDSADGDSYLPEMDNSSKSLPIFRQMLTSACPYTSSSNQVQMLVDGANVGVNISSSLLSFSNSPLVNNYGKEEVKQCNSSPINRNISYSKSQLIDSHTSLYGKLLKHVERTVPIEDKTDTEPIRSSRHNVQVRTAMEGEEIKSSVARPQRVCSSGRSSFQAEIIRTRKRKLVENNALIKKVFYLSNQEYTSDMFKKDHLDNSGVFKKRKADSKSSIRKVPQKVHSSITVINKKKKSVISQVKFQEYRRKNISDKVEIIRSTKVFTDPVEKVSRHLFPTPKKQERASQIMKLKGAVNRKQLANCNTIIEGIGNQRKRGAMSKHVGFYRKLAAVGSVRNCSVEIGIRDLCALTNGHSYRSDHTQQEKGENENPICSPSFEVSLNERTEKNAVSLFRKKHIFHINNSDQAESSNTENRDSVACAIDIINNKSAKEVPTSLLQTNSSSNSRLDFQKDISSDCKLVSPRNVCLDYRVIGSKDNEHVSVKDIPSDCRFLSPTNSENRLLPKDLSSTELKCVTYSSQLHQSSYSFAVSPQLRRSSLVNTISIPRKAEERKRLLSSFLLKPNGKVLSTSLIKSPLTKSSTAEKIKPARDKFRNTSGGRDGK